MKIRSQKHEADCSIQKQQCSLHIKDNIVLAFIL